MDVLPKVDVSQNTSNPPASTVTNLDRLSLPYIRRVWIGSIGGLSLGMFLGISYGAQMAGFRFRAENSHRLPKSPKGWYLYHKSKNYHMMLQGLKGGLKTGPSMALLSGGFFVAEEALDRCRGRQDFVSTTIAGIGIAGGYSLWSMQFLKMLYVLCCTFSLADKVILDRFHFYPAARTVKLALLTGLAFGAAQDALNLAKGRRLAYVDFLLRRDNAS
jgi:hypothetical protein